MHFSIDWKFVSRRNNIIRVQITFIDEAGVCEKYIKCYEEWIGVCTNDIDGIVGALRERFPDRKFLYKEIGRAKKVLPYFNDRLKTGNFEYESQKFYKLYTNANPKDIGRIFNGYDISYYDPDDWLIRIYIDLCFRHETYSFYYKWYHIRNDSNGLMESLEMVPDRKDQPDWTIAAFDLEAVPLVGNHVPMGYRETDKIVMISIFKWNRRYGIRKWLLYLFPKGGHEIDRPPDNIAFESESEMLIHFHSLIDDAQVLTGYNINSFDLPCIFARLVWLDLKALLGRYTSSKVGSDLVVTYDNKIVLDLYTYFKTFSGYDLPSFKLDDVARVKLAGETKLPVKATGIWSWYRNPLAAELLDEEDVETCFELLKPETVSKSSDFGTFQTYMDYCLKDSDLVHQLFEKEYVLLFLVERANFTALNAVQVLHYGNSHVLLNLFETYGLLLGFFVNPKFFNHDSNYDHLFQGGKTYQGALNYCTPEKIYEDVCVFDFVSMYPSTMLNMKLCYGTCTIMTREQWLSNENAQKMTCIRYQEHSGVDFTTPTTTPAQFSYPIFNPDVDEFAIVINTEAEAFLPYIVGHFIQLRKFHQGEYKRTKDVYHHNAQLCIKILINSLYGIMANKDSCLAYLPIAIAIVTLSRYQLLGSYHYLKNLEYDVCYADTDSLFVHKWDADDCDPVNTFLNLPHVELKFEQRMKRFLVISKKRYIYQQSSDIITKGFQKKLNGLVEFMTKNILNNVWNSIFEDGKKPTENQGWIIWADTVLEANYMARDPKKYSIYRKMKNLNEYKSSSCPSVKFLKKYPEKTLEHVELTYSRADVAATEASNWIMDVEDCKCVNYEKLFINQKRIFYTLLKMAYWKDVPDPQKMADMVLNNMHWKKFVHAELLHWHATGRHIVMLVEPGIKYTFIMNEHLRKAKAEKNKIDVAIEIFRKLKKREADSSEED